MNISSKLKKRLHEIDNMDISAEERERLIDEAESLAEDAWEAQEELRRESYEG